VGSHPTLKTPLPTEVGIGVLAVRVGFEGAKAPSLSTPYVLLSFV